MMNGCVPSAWTKMFPVPFRLLVVICFMPDVSMHGSASPLGVHFVDEDAGMDQH